MAAAKRFTVFFEAISSGVLDPIGYDQFWVEAGSMSSGGSHNQLELPRGANRFFGYGFDDYGSAHEVIGFPGLTTARRSWNDRKLTWHGNNMMERINLPTRRQGGFDYRKSAVLFTRTTNGFELQVVTWNDAAAVSWREKSDKLGRVYSLGENSDRICGLF